MSLRHVHELVEENRSLELQLKYAWQELAVERAKSAELRAQLEEVSLSLILPGWACRTCLVWNGEAVTRLAFCRCCGGRRP